MSREWSRVMIPIVYIASPTATRLPLALPAVMQVRRRCVTEWQDFLIALIIVA